MWCVDPFLTDCLYLQGLLNSGSDWARQLYKVGLCGLAMSGVGLPASQARASSAKEQFEAAKLAKELAAAGGVDIVMMADAEDAVAKAEAALKKEEEEAAAAEEAAGKERAEADAAKRRSQEEWADVIQAEKWLKKAEDALDAALMLPDGDAEVEAAEKEILKARAILEKETAEALAAEREFQREREEADVAEAKALVEREEAEAAKEALKSKEARARTGTAGGLVKQKKKAAVPKQVVRRRPRTAKFLMQRAVGKVNVNQRLRVETMEDTVKSLGIPLQGPPQHGPDGKCGRRNPPVLGAASADPLDRRRATGFGKKIHALHYSDTSLRTDGHLSQSSAMLQRPKDQSVIMAYKKGFSSAKSRSRPQSAAGNYTSGMSSMSAGGSMGSGMSNLAMEVEIVGMAQGLAAMSGHEPSAAPGLAPTNSWDKRLGGGGFSSFGSGSASSQGRQRPHTAGVVRRSVDSYVEPSTYTNVA